MCFRSDRLSDGWLMLCNLSKCHGTVLQLLKPASSSLSLSRIKFSSNSWNCAKTFASGFFQTKLTIPNKREGFFSIRIKFIGTYDEIKQVLITLSNQDFIWLFHYKSFQKEFLSFYDYVDKIFSFFCYLPTTTRKFLTPRIDKNKIFLTAFPPLLVQVVIERPSISSCETRGDYVK